jgi:hypothetical protein
VCVPRDPSTPYTSGNTTYTGRGVPKDHLAARYDPYNKHTPLNAPCCTYIVDQGPSGLCLLFVHTGLCYTNAATWHVSLSAC